MNKVSSREQLIEYCLKRLGAPVIKIDVEESQISDRVDEAIQFYREFHFNAIQQTYTKYQITLDDIKNKYITIPDELFVVERILPIRNLDSKDVLFDVNYHLTAQEVLSRVRGNGISTLSDYVQTRSHLSMLQSILGKNTTAIRFNRHMNRLYIDIQWDNTIKEGTWIVIEGITFIDPDEFTDIYNDMFLKRYTTALIKQQWGNNLSKFQGMELPGGVSFNADKILDSAKEEIEKLEIEIRETHEEPCDFFIG